MRSYMSAFQLNVGSTTMLEDVAGSVADPVPKQATKAPTSGVLKQAKDMGLRRVAGNLFERPASRDFWKVNKEGQIVRLVGSEVDLGESLEPADANDPETYINRIMADLEL